MQPKAFTPRTTDSTHGKRCAPNLLLDQPRPTQANRLWVSDITYLPLANGNWVYCCAFQDVCTKQVLAVSKRYAPGRDDVRVSSTSSNKEFTYVKNKEVFPGFNSKQSVTVRINDLRQLSPYLEELLATPISRIKDLSYGHSQADSLRREADVLALDDAVKTADKLCAALHGAVLEVSDSSIPESSNTNGYRPAANIELYSRASAARASR